MSASLLDLFPQPTVIPVAVIDDEATAVELARALQRGGLHSIEITLRTAGAPQAAEAVREAMPDLQLGIGTVTRPEQLTWARELGAAFAVSPGLDETLVKQALDIGLPYLPGVFTPSELMQAQAMGCDAVKVFPASKAGGPGFLQQLASICPTARFCPTGGINQDNLTDYLAAPGVFSVGGSWLAPGSLMARADWSGIEDLARDAAETCRSLIRS